MEFNIYGKVSFDVDLTVEAETEKQALELAKERLMDYYRLNVIGADHDPEDVNVDLNLYAHDDTDDEDEDGFNEDDEDCENYGDDGAQDRD